MKRNGNCIWKKSTRFFCFFLICICLTGLAVDLRAYRLEAGGSRYIATAWTIEKGLPQNSVLSLIQTRQGYIWFGTQSGLVRFDGVTLKIYNQWNTPGLKNDRILALYEDKNGVLWVGTDGGGISRMKDRVWQSYNTKDGLSHDTVNVITGDNENNLWIGTGYGLNRLTKGKIKGYTPVDGFPGYPVNTLVVRGDGTLWVGSGSSVRRMKNNKLQTVPFENDLFPHEVTVLYEDRSGTLWIGAENNLYYLEKGKIKEYKTPDNIAALSGIPIKTITEDSSGTLLMGTDGEGFYRLKDKQVTFITTSLGLPDDYIYSLLEDHEGNIWLGTYTNGLVRLKTAVVNTITAGNGLPENRVKTVLRDDKGYLWVGTDRKGLAKVKIKNNAAVVTQTFTTADGLSGNKITSLCLDGKKNLWIGTTNGLNKLEQGKIRVYTSGDGLSSGHITAIFYPDRPGTLWIGTVQGLNRFDGERFTSYRKSSGFSPGKTRIRTLGADSQGNLCAGTSRGLFLLKDQGGGPLAPNRDILAFYRESNGDLWIGTNGSGLIRYKGGNPAFRTDYTIDSGLPANYIFSITGDKRGSLWMSSYRGVYRVSKRDPGTGSPCGITVVSFDEEEGMGSRECALGGQPAAWKTPGGRLFIPTVKGVAVFDTVAITAGGKPPAVIIEDVFADNRSIIKTKENKRTLPPGSRVVEFYFTALSFTAPGKVRLKYKLEGFDTQWKEVSPGQKRAAFYLNLPAGRYCFHVTACNHAGIWNRSGARFNFDIKAPFYKHPGFYLAVLLGLAILAGGAYLYFLKKTKTPVKDEKKEPLEKYKTSALLPETVETVLPQLTRMMNEEKLFLEPDLNLQKLSQKLNVHYNHLSRIINEHLGKSFNDYINSLRIEEAKKKLADPGEIQKTILEIAYDTGFYSKSVFNTAFKKFTGMTPSQYRKKMKR